MANKTPIAAIFESLKGSWRLRRTLNSALPGFPSGLFEGVATFKPRRPSAHSVASELLYTEDGELKTDNGLTFRANRKYIYRYSADEDKISAWFVTEATKQHDGREEVDYLFHDLEMAPENGIWAGRGEHLCSLDMYWSYYEFRYPSGGSASAEGNDGADEAAAAAATAATAMDMNVFGVRYKVKGPQKDYTTDTAYERSLATGDVAAAL